MTNNYYNDPYSSTFNHYFYKDGFCFTAITEPAYIQDAIVLRNPDNCICWSPNMGKSTHSMEEHIKYINNKKIQKAFVIAESIDFIGNCESLTQLEIHPADTAPNNFDYSPLYFMNNLVYLDCRTSYGGSKEHLHTTIDYAQIPNLERLCVRGMGNLNYSKLKELREIEIFDDNSLEGFPFFESDKLERVRIFGCSISSLAGIGKHRINKLSLEYDRRMNDVAEISALRDSLEYLYIENCAKITDFSFLDKLHNLKELELLGGNKLESLSFLNEMPDLEFFRFSVEVSDGDMNPCLRIPKVICLKHKKYYNMKIGKIK